jgi:hypothetical protein
MSPVGGADVSAVYHSNVIGQKVNFNRVIDEIR